MGGTLVSDDDLLNVQAITGWWNYDSESKIARLTNWEKDGIHIYATYRFAYKHKRNHMINIPLEAKYEVQFTFHYVGKNRFVAWRIEPKHSKYITLDKWFGQDASGTRPKIN